MFSVPVLLLVSGLICAALAEKQPVPTFETRDPATGETLTCDRCPPGTHKVAPCSATVATQCAPCTRDHFTELWNFLPRCLYCNNFCTENQEVALECSPANNRVCRCAQGFYGADGFCVRHSECEAGHGVQTPGSSQTDTACEKCSDGFFSNSSSVQQPCVKHQECADEQILILPGTLYHDSVCGTCEDLAKGGEILRTFLSGIITAHRMRLGRMKKFVKLMDKLVSRQRDVLLQEIRAWLAQAPEEELRKLPRMLRSSHLKALAEKLQKSLKEIQRQNPGCDLNLWEDCN